MDSIMTQVLQAQARVSGNNCQDIPGQAEAGDTRPAPPMPEASLTEAYAVLNQQWELLSQHLHMLGAGTDSEVFASLARKAMDMLKPSPNSFSALPPAIIGQAPEANPGISTQLEPVKPETLLATVESLLNKNMVHVENTLAGGNQGLATPKFKPFSVSSLS